MRDSLCLLESLIITELCEIAMDFDELCFSDNKGSALCVF